MKDNDSDNAQPNSGVPFTGPHSPSGPPSGPHSPSGPPPGPHSPSGPPSGPHSPLGPPALNMSLTSSVATPVAGVLADAIPQGVVTVDKVSKMFPGTPVKNIADNLPLVLQAMADAELSDTNMILMALSTIRAETASFRPISEGISKFNTTPGKHPFDKYDDREDLGNRGRPDGERYKGRGFIQLTGRTNYRQHGSAIGLGNALIDKPELANQPDIAAKILASFIKDKEQAIRKALNAGDLKKARKLVNGGSHGLTEFKQAFKTGQTLLNA